MGRRRARPELGRARDDRIRLHPRRGHTGMLVIKAGVLALALALWVVLVATVIERTMLASTVRAPTTVCRLVGVGCW
jgi:hypothetical protein